MTMGPGRPKARGNARWLFDMQLHLHRRVFEEQSCWLYKDRLAWLEIPDKGIASCVQQEQAWRLRSREAIEKHTEWIVCFGLVAVPGWNEI